MGKYACFEICQKANSTLSKETIERMARSAVAKCRRVKPDKNLLAESSDIFDPIEDFAKHVECVMFSNDEWKDRSGYEVTSDVECPNEARICVYRLSRDGAATETMQHESEELSVASHIVLPAVEYQGLWETLCYEENIKGGLLNYFETAIEFSERGVDANVISLNKVILLHGPPGTGKTSLCRALAHKAAIRLSDKYSSAQLIEIHSHSLFSKWFSESGKLVMKLFDEVRRLLQDPKTLVCVLIDEVESLAHARKSCANGNEPSDALRVVNAVLTQLDQIKNYPNVVILTTSNVTETIDLAFVDRADVKQFVGLPGRIAVRQIYVSCINELARTGLIEWSTSDKLENFDRCESPLLREGEEVAKWLARLTERSAGLSGRSLRKIPFLAYALYVRRGRCSVPQFLDAMEKAIASYRKSEEVLS